MKRPRASEGERRGVVEPRSGPTALVEEVCEIGGADPGRVERGREGLLREREYARLAETFRVLADPSRAKIVHCLLREALCTCDLAAITSLSEPAVSQHLRLLRALRLVKTRREGRKVYYSLDDAHVRFLLRVSLRHVAHADDSADSRESSDDRRDPSDDLPGDSERGGGGW